MSKATNPYGDGHACQRILEALKKKSGDIMSFETISVIGLGYIGLPTAAALPLVKKSVIGVDVNQHAVDTINKGQIHIVEPDLDKVVKQAVEEGHLKPIPRHSQQMLTLLLYLHHLKVSMGLIWLMLKQPHALSHLYWKKGDLIIQNQPHQLALLKKWLSG